MNYLRADVPRMIQTVSPQVGTTGAQRRPSCPSFWLQFPLALTQQNGNAQGATITMQGLAAARGTTRSLTLQ